MNLTKKDIIALKRVFRTDDPDRVSKGRLITANTSHIAFIDFMMLELYMYNPKHEIFLEYTPEQHALAKMRIEVQHGKGGHAPKCTEASCAEECDVAAHEEARLLEAGAAKVGAPSITSTSSDGEQQSGIVINRMINLCDSCTFSFPGCAAEDEDVEFGDSVGKDNVIVCKKYQRKKYPRKIA